MLGREVEFASMNKPVDLQTTKLEPAAPVVAVPVPAPVSAKAEPPHSRSRKIWWIAGSLSLALVVAIGVAWWLSSASGTVHYTTAPVTRGAVTRAVTATGTVNPGAHHHRRNLCVRRHPGALLRLQHASEEAARSAPRSIRAPIRRSSIRTKPISTSAKAQLEKDKANLAYAKLNYERNAQAGSRPTRCPRTPLDNAKSALRSGAGADRRSTRPPSQQRQAQLDAAQVNLDYTNIVSPVDGTVVSRNVTMGQTVAASFQTPTLFLIATDLTKMQVDTNVSESDIGGIKEGNKATFTVDAFPKRTLRGRGHPGAAVAADACRTS